MELGARMISSLNGIINCSDVIKSKVFRVTDDRDVGDASRVTITVIYGRYYKNFSGNN